MEEVKRRRDLFALLLFLCAASTVWFAVCGIPEAMTISVGGSVVWLTALIRQSCRLYEAQLIWDNRILLVSAAVIMLPGAPEKQKELNLVISTFGAMVGARIYKWGCDGIQLHSIAIDRKRIFLSFGDATETKRLELMHDISDAQIISKVTQTLWQETGVAPAISGW